MFQEGLLLPTYYQHRTLQSGNTKGPASRLQIVAYVLLLLESCLENFLLLHRSIPEAADVDTMLTHNADTLRQHLDQTNLQQSHAWAG